MPGKGFFIGLSVLTRIYESFIGISRPNGILSVTLFREPVMHAVLTDSDSAAPLCYREIASEAVRRLHRCAELQGRPVSCRVEGSVLSLSGRVANYYQKQLAHLVVRGIPGVDRVVNEIDVAVNSFGVESGRACPACF